MEVMIKLDKTDDYKEVARQIIPQLQHIHSFGVHSGIKPDNIMKRMGTPKEYYLIDFGGSSMERQDDGYIRYSHSYRWTTQDQDSGDPTYPKQDLLELTFTLKFLLNFKIGVHNEGGHGDKCDHYRLKHKSKVCDNVRTGFNQRLKDYFEITNNLPEKRHLSDRTYERLLEIFE